MSAAEELVTPSDALAESATFTSGEIDRMQRVQSFFEEAFPLVCNLEAVNEELSKVDRADLTISELAPMVQTTGLVDGLHLRTNFTAKFRVVTGTKEVSATGFLGIERTEYEPIHVTRNQLEALAQGRQSVQEWKAGNHASKPAFQRMLVLFPAFTIELVLAMDSRYPSLVIGRYAAELFVAYQLMSRLVDKSDPYVRGIDGKLDSYYILSH